MSFSFNAVGTREEVLSQLKAAYLAPGEHRFNAVGTELRDLLAKHFEAETAQAGAGYEYRYTVEASGHSGGGSALCLDVKVRPLWIALPEPEIATAGTEHLAEGPAVAVAGDGED